MPIIADIPTAIPDSDFNGFLQPGSSDSVNDVGVRTISQSYINTRGSMQVPRVKTPHPVFTELLLEEASLTFQEGDYEQLDVTYKGNSGESFGSVTTASGNASLYPVVTALTRLLSQEPLDAHPNFTGTSTSIVGVACGNDGESEDSTIIIRDGDGAFVRISDKAKDPSLRGVSSYLAPGAEFTIRYAKDSLPSLTRVGKIVENPQGAPSVSGDYNWLLNSITYTQEGDIFEVTETYLLSGENGWADSIYLTTL